MGKNIIHKGRRVAWGVSHPGGLRLGICSLLTIMAPLEAPLRASGGFACGRKGRGMKQPGRKEGIRPRESHYIYP